MRLSAVLRQPDFIDGNIEIVKKLKTADAEYVVLGRRGQTAWPSPLEDNTHLIFVTDEDNDPDVSSYEELTIRRRLGLRVPPIRRSNVDEKR
jgi:hypothetical protein